MSIEEQFLPEADSWGHCQCKVCSQYVFDGQNLERKTLHRSKWVCHAYKLWMTFPSEKRGRTFYISSWGGKPELILHLPTDISRTFNSYQDVETYLHDPLNARTGQNVSNSPTPNNCPF